MKRGFNDFSSTTTLLPNAVIKKKKFPQRRNNNSRFNQSFVMNEEVGEHYNDELNYNNNFLNNNIMESKMIDEDEPGEVFSSSTINFQHLNYNADHHQEIHSSSSSCSLPSSSLNSYVHYNSSYLNNKNNILLDKLCGEYRYIKPKLCNCNPSQIFPIPCCLQQSRWRDVFNNRQFQFEIVKKDFNNYIFEFTESYDTEPFKYLPEIHYQIVLHGKIEIIDVKNNNNCILQQERSIFKQNNIVDINEDHHYRVYLHVLRQKDYKSFDQNTINHSNSSNTLMLHSDEEKDEWVEVGCFQPTIISNEVENYGKTTATMNATQAALNAPIISSYTLLTFELLNKRFYFKQTVE
ncbi:hypothetical protein ABK040_015635 [Willaertia magna]